MATETITITADVPDGMEFDRLDGDRILYRKKRWRAEPDGLYWTIYCGGLCLFADIRTRTEDQCWESGLYWRTKAEGEAWLARAHAANQPAVAEEWPKEGEWVWASVTYEGEIYDKACRIPYSAGAERDRERLASGNIHRTEAEANAKIAEMLAVRESSETTTDLSPACTPSRAEAVTQWRPKPGARAWVTTRRAVPCPPRQVEWDGMFVFRPGHCFPTREMARAAWKVHPANPKQKGGAK